ncbi:MAG TPA: hypothetical protein VG055_14120 [Planctomycetaceae bacterium]|jgi:hypothetical protein|nr:hypothetical protein [Planctomycetaceae bacterium]
MSIGTDILLSFKSLWPGWPRGLKVVPMGVKRDLEVIEKRTRPRAARTFWSDSEPLARGEIQPETDTLELSEGYATLTPLHIDITHRQLMDRFAGFEWSLEYRRVRNRISPSVRLPSEWERGKITAETDATRWKTARADDAMRREQRALKLGSLLLGNCGFINASAGMF